MNDHFLGPGGGFLTGFGAGSVIAGYRVEKLLGAGGMAMVYLAHDDRLDRRVAVKVLSPTLSSNEAIRRRFIQESRAAAKVEDPHIIPVYEAGEADGVLFIAMRYVAAGDAGGLLAREGPLSAARVSAVVSAVASALDSAHAVGLVHRDVKPANILLDIRPGRADHVYLSDFGLSKGSLATTGLTRSGQFVGTPDYTAPEQIQGQPVSGPMDQYALACTAFELLTGEPVYARDLGVSLMYAHLNEPPPSLASRRPDLPAEAGAVLARALAKTPGDRYPSCQEFAEALREGLGLPAVPGPAAVTDPGAVLAVPAPAAAARAPVTEMGQALAAPMSPTGITPPPVTPLTEIGPAPVTPAAVTQVPVTPVPVTPPPAPVPVTPVDGQDQPPAGPPPAGGQPVSRRTLLIAGAAAVPVAAGAWWFFIRKPGHGPVWQTRIEGPNTALLQGDADLVITAAGPAGRLLHGLDAASGKPRWDVTTPSGTIAGAEVNAGQVYLVLDQGANPFLALSARTGGTLWTSGETTQTGIATSPGFVYFGIDEMAKLSAEDGSMAWTVPAQQKSNPLVSGSTLYVLAAGVEGQQGPTLAALSIEDGTTRWQSTGPSIAAALDTDGSLVSLVTGKDDPSPGQLWTFRASDGKVLWATRPGQAYTPPAVAGGVVYAIRQQDGLLTAVTGGGKQLWSYPADPQVFPEVVNSVVYVGDRSGGLAALNASDGSVRWQSPIRFGNGPVVAGGLVYISDSTTVYALPA